MSVIVPFLGGRGEVLSVIDALEELDLLDGDELIIADNTLTAVAASAVRERTDAPVQAVEAAAERSSYYARNVGAEHARRDWLLFLDADCRPIPGLLDEFFAEPIAEDVGAIAGEVRGAEGREGLVARYSGARRYLSQAAYRAHEHGSFAVTANLLVRRIAWSDLGGFLEGVRSSADGEFSWRLQQAGWRLDIRARAIVEHQHRQSVGALMRQAARYQAGTAWLNRRYDYPLERPRVGRAIRAFGAAARWTLAGQKERARFRALDGVVEAAGLVGYARSNAVASNDRHSVLADLSTGATEPGVVLFAERFPESSEPSAACVEPRIGAEVIAVEAERRPQRPDRRLARALPIAYREDDSLAGQTRDLAWLLACHPVRSAADIALRPRRPGELLAPLHALAPVARRVARHGRPRLRALGREAEPSVERVAALVGLAKAPAADSH